MKVNFDLSKLKDIINKVYYEALKQQQRYAVFYGGAGSGKSHFIAQKYLIRIIAGFNTGKRHKILALRKTQPAVRKSVFALFKAYIGAWGLTELCKINKQDMTVEFINGSMILCCGLDEPEKLKSIEGITSIWMEEATEFTLKDFRQVDLRLRGRTASYKQITLSFNPISKQSWIHKHFFKRKRKSCVILQTTYKDNKFLDKEYITMLKGLKNEDKTYHQIYALGEWGVLKNIIYQNWDLIPCMPDNLDVEGYCLDFGFNNPSFVGHVGVKDKELYIDELLYEEGLTNTDLIARMESVCAKDLEAVADSAEPDRIKEIQNAGFMCVAARKGKNSVKDGIDILKRSKMHITRRSINIKNELESYKYKEDKDGNVFDEPVKINDHAMDGIRYWGLRNADMLGVSIFGADEPKEEKDPDSPIDRQAIYDDDSAWRDFG